MVLMLMVMDLMVLLLMVPMSVFDCEFASLVGVIGQRRNWKTAMLLLLLTVHALAANTIL